MRLRRPIDVGSRWWALVLLVLQAAAASGQQARVLSIRPESSEITILVDKAGAFGFAGHVHHVATRGASIRGEVRVVEKEPARSSVRVEVDARQLQVTGEGEPQQDVPEVQRTMQMKVLEVERYSQILFESRRLEVVRRTADGARLRITGDLTLHGVTREQTLEADVRLAPDRLRAEGELTIRQTDFRIEPVSAAAGLVKVADRLKVHFAIEAR